MQVSLSGALTNLDGFMTDIMAEYILGVSSLLFLIIGYYSLKNQYKSQK
jgi:cell shape-determining protein MreD